MPGRSPSRSSPPPPPLISRYSLLRDRNPSPDHRLPSTSRIHIERRPSSMRRSRSSDSPPVKRKASSPGRGREQSRRHKLREREYEKDLSSMPYARGPEGAVDLNVSELKKYRVEITQRLPRASDNTVINRAIINPDDIAPVRRPDEGSRPLFRNTAMAGTSHDKKESPPVEYRRIVAQTSSRDTVRRSPPQTHERLRYSSPPYDEPSRRSYHIEKARSPQYEPRYHSPPKEKYERREESRDRREHEGRKRRYSLERAYEKESDLRLRLNEKRQEERGEHSRRYDGDKERHGRTHSSPPQRERKRHGSTNRYESSRSRGEAGERDGEKRRRDERGRDRDENSDHGETAHQEQYEANTFYKHYNTKEFIPIPVRGHPMFRGRPLLVRGPPMMLAPIMPPPMIVPPPILRLLARGAMRGGLRGAMRHIAPRGVPQRPFMPRIPHPRFFPPY